MKYIVETRNLSKNFKGYKAVDNIDMKVEEGKIYGFLGPNGAGKSTTIRMLLGLIKESQGEVKIFGLDIHKNREEILGQVGALVESPSYYGHLTAYENLEIVRRILKLDKSNIYEVLELVKLSDVKDKKVNQFSLGMKQRLGIAQALIGKPKLLILDEPTNGLDPSGIIEIRELIKALPEKLGITVIISSHILSEIELIAHEVGVINKGKLIYQGHMKDLKKNSSRKIVVEVDRRNECYELLVKRKYRVEEDGNRLLVRGDELTPSKLCRELVMTGFEVSYLCEEEKSLENIFLELTKESILN